MWDELVNYMQYPFVRYALIVGILISLCSSLLGVILVLKRFSFIVDGLSHIAFGVLAVAIVLKVIFKNSYIANLLDVTNNTILVMPLTILAAILLLKKGNNRKVKADASLAMLSVGSLAVGYLILNIFPASSNVSGDVCTTLFGSTSILTLSQSEVITSIVMSIVVILMFVFLYNRIFAVTFDENFAKATGTNVEFYNLLIAIVVAIIVVLAMDLVGSLLISALIVFPALSAMRFLENFKQVVIASAIISVFCSIVGILVAILISTPVGATIVAVDIVVFLLANLAGKIVCK